MRSIIIDNANLRFMLRGLGVHHIDYKILRRILAEEIGQDENGQTPPLAHNPVITIPHIVSPRFVRYLESLDYECLRYEMGTGEDDRLLIERIRALDSEQVTEIVMVTADQDFNPALQMKHFAGMQIFWVASMHVSDPKNRQQMVSPYLALSFGETETFCFVELADFVPQLKGIQPPSP